ncbi:MAG: carbohydrate-binding domain-containing protein [Clostridia bacterium]|nr:carbohydrate-binding domain-containing protein [Clostridia bacterium]
MNIYKKLGLFMLVIILTFGNTSCIKSSTNEENSSGPDTSKAELMPNIQNPDISTPNVPKDTEDHTDKVQSAMPAETDMFTKNDLKDESDFKNAKELILSGSEDITVSHEGEYLVSGKLSGASLIIDADKSAKVRLIFNGVDISVVGTAAVHIKQADKVFITLAENGGRENIIKSQGEFAEADGSNVDAAIFSKEDLTFGGGGKLKIECEKGNGISSKDDLVFTGGSYDISAASHGIEGKDSVRITASSFEIKSGKDAIHAENDDDASLGYLYIESGSFEISAEGDGLQCSSDMKIKGGSFNIDSAEDALHSNGNISLDDGSFNILASDDALHADFNVKISGGKITVSGSYEGIEGESIDILGGEIDIRSSDDGLNAAGGADESGFGGPFAPGRKDAFGKSQNNSYINIEGGILRIDAEGDGIDSNGNITVKGGRTYINGPSKSGNGALDYQLGASISGGIFVAAGVSGMAQNFDSSSTQGSILMSCRGTEPILLTDDNGKELISFTPTKNCQSVVISCAELELDKKYIYKCGEVTTEFTLSTLIYGSSGGHTGHGSPFGPGKPGGFGGFGTPPQNAPSPF